MLASLAGCTGNQLTWKSGDKVYYDRIVFDTSDESAPNPNFYLGMDKKITSVKVGKYDIDFGYRGKVLTLSAESLTLRMKSSMPKPYLPNVKTTNSLPLAFDTS